MTRYVRLKPYREWITRNRPALFLFLIDQSDSSPTYESADKKSASTLIADAVNHWLQDLIIRWCRDSGVVDDFHVGAIGYCTRRDGTTSIGPAWQGLLCADVMASINAINSHPTRLQTVRQPFFDDETGETFEMECEIQVWIDPVSVGERPMCAAFEMAHETAAKWIESHHNSIPPFIINLTSGPSTDGDPRAAAAKLRSLRTNNGNVLLTNLYFSGSGDACFLHSSPQSLNETCSVLFEMSSELPEFFARSLAKDGYEFRPQARCMVYEMDGLGLLRHFIQRAGSGPDGLDDFEECSATDPGASAYEQKDGWIQITSGSSMTAIRSEPNPSRPVPPPPLPKPPG